MFDVGDNRKEKKISLALSTWTIARKITGTALSFLIAGALCHESHFVTRPRNDGTGPLRCLPIPPGFLTRVHALLPLWDGKAVPSEASCRGHVSYRWEGDVCVAGCVRSEGFTLPALQTWPLSHSCTLPECGPLGFRVLPPLLGQWSLVD